MHRRLTLCAFPLCSSSTSYSRTLQPTFFMITPRRYIPFALFFTSLLHSSSLLFTFLSMSPTSLHLQERVEAIYCLEIHGTHKQHAGIRWRLNLHCVCAISMLNRMRVVEAAPAAHSATRMPLFCAGSMQIAVKLPRTTGPKTRLLDQGENFGSS